MFGWIKRRRDTQHVIATLTAENERLRSEIARLRRCLGDLAKDASVAAGVESSWKAVKA